jgi:hypothetical protein
MADQKIVVYRGEDVDLLFSPLEATVITGWDLMFSIAIPGSAPLLQLTSDDGDITITSATNGDFTVSITRADTSDLTRTTPYVWDVWRTDTGSYQRLAGGQFLVLSPVLPPA